MQTPANHSCTLNVTNTDINTRKTVVEMQLERRHAAREVSLNVGVVAPSSELNVKDSVPSAL